MSGSLDKEGGRSSRPLTSHFRVRAFPFPVLQGIGESTVSPLLSLDWKCNFWLGDKFHWNKANKQHALWIHYNGIFNSIGMMCTFKEKDILENGEPSKSYRFRRVELGKFTAAVFQRKEDMSLEGKKHSPISSLVPQYKDADHTPGTHGGAGNAAMSQTETDPVLVARTF